MTDKINVTNNHTGVLNVAGVDIRPGATSAVDAKTFGTWKLGNAASIWLDQELIVVGDKSGSKIKEVKAKEPETDAGKGADGKVDRAAFLARAKELDLGLKANVSNADLVKAVNEAEAKKALEAGNGGEGSGDEGSGGEGGQGGE